MFTAFSYTMAGRKRNLTARRSNEDRVLIRSFETDQGGPAILAAVADGVSRCADGGAVAQWLIHERLAQDPILREGARLRDATAAYLKQVHDDFLRRFADNPDMLESACTLAGVLVRGTQACVFWCGDSPVHHLRRLSGRLEGKTLTTPDKIHGTAMLTDCFSALTAFAFRMQVLDVEPGDYLICASDGLVPEAAELAESLNEHEFSKEWAKTICTYSYNFPGSDDIAVAAVRID